MARYHIARDGVTRICRTQVGRDCPLGGRHFKNHDEVMFYEAEVAAAQEAQAETRVQLTKRFQGGDAKRVLDDYYGGAYPKGDALAKLRGLAGDEYVLADNDRAIDALNRYNIVRNESTIAGQLAACFEVAPTNTKLIAWERWAVHPQLDLELQRVAAEAYSAHDIETVEQAVVAAHEQLIADYREAGSLGEEKVQILTQNREAVRARLRPMLEQFFRVGHLF